VRPAGGPKSPTARLSHWSRQILYPELLDGAFRVSFEGLEEAGTALGHAEPRLIVEMGCRGERPLAKVLQRPRGLIEVSKDGR
jgi:hypothetical protein